MTFQMTLKCFIITLLVSITTADILDNSIDNVNASTTKQYQNSLGTTGYPGSNGFNTGIPGYNNNRPNGFNTGNNQFQNQPTGQASFPMNNGYGTNNNGYGNNGYGNNGLNNMNNNNGYNNGNRNRRTFQSAREWNNDFMRRYQEVVNRIPQQAYDMYQQNQINAARRWANGMQSNYNSRSDYYLNLPNRQGEMHMKQKEERLNSLGRTYFPLNWSSQQCGTNAYWNECGQFTN